MPFLALRSTLYAFFTCFSSRVPIQIYHTSSVNERKREQCNGSNGGSSSSSFGGRGGSGSSNDSRTEEQPTVWSCCSIPMREENCSIQLSSNINLLLLLRYFISGFRIRPLSTCCSVCGNVAFAEEVNEIVLVPRTCSTHIRTNISTPLDPIVHANYIAFIRLQRKNEK